MENKEYFSFSLKQKQSSESIVRGILSAVILSCRNVGSVCSSMEDWAVGHLPNFLLLSFKFYEQLISGKINKKRALVVASEKRSWGTGVAGRLNFHSIPLKKCLNHLKLTAHACIAYTKILTKKIVWIDTANYHKTWWSLKKCFLMFLEETTISLKTSMTAHHQNK